VNPPKVMASLTVGGGSSAASEGSGTGCVAATGPYQLSNVGARQLTKGVLVGTALGVPVGKA